MLSIFSKQKIYIVIFYIVLVFVFKVSVLDKPIWWSERAYVEGAIKVYQNNLNPFVEFHSYKPPLLFVLTALGYKIFGTSTVVPRFIIALFAVATLYFTFLLGKKIYSKEAGFFASLLLFFSATFFTQSESFVAALPVAALALATIYFYFTNKKWGYFISAGLLVLTKELAILILVAIVLYEILNSVYSFLKLPKKASFPNSLKGLISKIAFLLSPTLFFFMWMIGNKILLGWFLWPLNAEIIKNTAFNAWEIKWILYRLFWDDFRFLITAAVIICFLKNTVRKQFIKKEVMLFYILAVITIIAFWMGCGVHPAGIDDIPPLPRYYLYLQPLFFILGAQSILALFRKKFLYSMIFAIVIGVLLIAGAMTLTKFSKRYGLARLKKK